MNRFAYVRAQGVGDALEAIRSADRAQFLAGGTNLVDLLRENVARPNTVVDVGRLPLNQVESTTEGGLRIGALVTNSDLAYHPEIVRRYPLLSRAILAGASPQLRNLATTGGNLLQRTRCYYFYDAMLPCNKRIPGSGCPAILGVNRIHAILGTSEHCIAVHPSDMCVALAALEATVHVEGPSGPREIAFKDFHRLPGDTPHLDSNLAPDELIVAVSLPSTGFAEHSAYLKVRDRDSYAFALVSVAAALEIENGVIRTARLALGGVAHKPWRDPEAEALLVDRPVGEEAFRAAAEQVVRGASGFGYNNFKVELARRAFVRALHGAVANELLP